MYSQINRSEIAQPQRQTADTGPKHIKDEFAKMMEESSQADNADRQAKNRGKKETAGRENIRQQAEYVLVVQQLSEVQKSLIEAMDGSDTGIEAMRSSRKERRRNNRDAVETDKDRLRDAQFEMVELLKHASKDTNRETDMMETIMRQAREALHTIPEPGRSARLAPFEKCLGDYSREQLLAIVAGLETKELTISQVMRGDLPELSTEAGGRETVSRLDVDPLPIRVDMQRLIKLIQDGDAGLEADLMQSGTGYVLDMDHRPLAALVRVSGVNDQYLVAAPPAHMMGKDLPHRDIVMPSEVPGLIGGDWQGFGDFHQVRIDGRRRLIGRDCARPDQFSLLDPPGRRDSKALDGPKPSREVRLVDGYFVPVGKQEGVDCLLVGGRPRYPLVEMSVEAEKDIPEWAAAVSVDQRVYEVTPKSGHILWELVMLPEAEESTAPIARFPTPLRGSIIAENGTALSRLCGKLIGRGSAAPEKGHVLPLIPRVLSDQEFLNTYALLKSPAEQATSLYFDKNRLERRNLVGNLDFRPVGAGQPAKDQTMPSLLMEAEAIQGLSPRDAERVQRDIWEMRVEGW